MPCYHPLTAWRTTDDKIVLTKAPPAPGAPELRLPCGRCVGCNLAHAKAWTLRCKLELAYHHSAAFTTLTYADGPYKPPTLDKTHLKAFIKRLREHRRRTGPRFTANPIAGIHDNHRLRYFASGEYGETNGRPHYHAILYGPSVLDADLIQSKWPYGYTHTDSVNIANIAYVAGYTNKKANWRWQRFLQRDLVDPDTGEVYDWQPPFVEMSTNPGIGAAAKQFANSWRSFAVLNGRPMPVPRYLHQAWEEIATYEQKQLLQQEKQNFLLARDRSINRLEAEEKIAIASQAEAARNRRL